MQEAASSSAVQDHILSRDGLKLSLRAWLPPEEARAHVIVVHGYAEHCGRYEHLGRYLNERGIAVFGYDQRGHGRSEGRRAYVTSFNDYVDDLVWVVEAVQTAQGRHPVYLFGHSMGGTVTLLYCLERDVKPAGLILSSPFIKVGADVSPRLQHFADILGSFFPWLPTITLNRKLLSRDVEVVAQAENDPLNFHGRLRARTGAEMARAAKHVYTHMERVRLPLLVIQGGKDQLTDPTGSTELYERALSEDKSLGFYPDLYHETLNEPEKDQVLDEIGAWLEEHLTTPPSSTE